jgi:thiamine-monophosphate kinase
MEREFIDWLRTRLLPHNRLRLGPGDDAALVQLAQSADCVVTTDMLMDGVDFHLAEHDPRRIGRKALAVNLSDLAAMAARPVAAVVSLALPKTGGKQLAEELYEGLIPLAEEFDTTIAGGDTNSWNGPLAISITAIGETTSRGALLRSGAKPGDAILVTGSFGGSILGKHFDFTPRVREAILLNERYELHAGIDVSDGLSLDLFRLAEESRCGALLNFEAIPVSAAATELARHQADGSSPLDHALSDGEDFELILAVPSAEAARLLADQPLGVPVTKIGEFAPDRGLWRRMPDGSREPVVPRGYEHAF